MRRVPYSLLVTCPVCGSRPRVRCYYNDRVSPYYGQYKRMAHKLRTYKARAQGLG